MKKVLIATFNTPGYAPNELIAYLISKRHHDIETFRASVPAKHERRCIPGLSHWSNMQSVIKQARRTQEHYDVAIGPDSTLVLALCKLRDLGLVDKVTYYRLDYYPYYHNRLLNTLYQKTEKAALKLADEIWTISSPKLPYVAENLQEHLYKVKYVPYLLHLDRVQNRVDPQARQNRALWIGPDLDNSRPLCQIAAGMVGIPFTIADYSIDKYRLEDPDLEIALRTAKVGLAVYKPEPRSSKYYCDASRIRRFLAYGVPVVTTPVAPTHTTLIEGNCGYICEFDNNDVARGISYCLEHFEELSDNAYKAAEKYTFENWFSKNPNLL